MHWKEIMKRGKISSNVIVGLLCGVAIYLYLGLSHHSVVEPVIFLVIAAIGAILVNRSKTGRKQDPARFSRGDCKRQMG